MGLRKLSRGLFLGAAVALGTCYAAMAQPCGTTNGLKWCLKPAPKPPICGAVAVRSDGFMSCASIGDGAVGELHEPTGSELGQTFTGDRAGDQQRVLRVW
jgi:hypothetical protein